MFTDKIFPIALLTSVIVHGVILFQNANFNIFSRNKSEQKIQVNFLKEIKKLPPQKKASTAKKEPLLYRLPQKITARESAPPPFVDRDDFFKKSSQRLSQPDFPKPTLAKTDVAVPRKKITLPALNLEKMNNPSYISYYQIVREKIKRTAYQNYTSTETGEVYLSFVVLNDGTLSQARIIEDKSANSQYLREIALGSVKDASPFPKFPAELDYPQLSFNVVISFEIEQ